MKNTKALSLVLAIVTLLSALSFMGTTAFAATSGDYQYTVLSNGTAEITKYTGSATSLTIPSKIGSYSVTKIGNSAFSQNTKLTSVTIPNGVTSIGLHAFNSCTSLKSVSIPNTVTSIVQNAFFGCSSLTSVTIPSSVTSIGYYVFSGCHKLTSINVDSNNKNYSSQDGVLFNKNKTTLVQYPLGNTRTSYTIPGTVKTILDRAFANADKLTSITIPSSVTTLENYAFEGCSGLTRITIPNSVKSMGVGVFSSCTGLTAFTMPSGVTSIPKQMFCYCSSLKSVNVHSGITSVGDSAFNMCRSLTDIYYSGSSAQWGKISVGSSNSALLNAVKHYNCVSRVSTPNLISAISTSTGVKVTWGAVSGAEKYRLFYKTGNVSWTKIADTTSTSYTWAGAKSGTKYTFTVRCVDSSGTVYTSSYDSTGISITHIAPSTSTTQSTTTAQNTNTAQSTTTAKSNLSAPKLSSVSNTATGVNITWGKVTGAAKYRVFYKTSSNGWTKIADTTSTSYTWTGAKSGTKYTFTVRCITSDGASYTSSYDSTGKSITYIAAPKLSSVSNTTNGVKISWGTVTGAQKYRVFYKTSNGSWAKITDTTSTSYTWTGAKSGTKYTFTVRCISSDGKSYTSSYDSTGKSITYTPAYSLATPQLSSVSNTSTGVNITWGKVNGAAKYRVFYKTANSDWTKITDTTSTSYTWTGAKSGTKYTFTVRCISSDGKSYTSSYDSTGKSITYTPAYSLATPKLSTVENIATGVNITWGKVTGAAKYRVYYKTSNIGWTKIADTTSTSYTWTGAKSGTKYTFTVRCISSDAKSYTSSYDNVGKSITFLSAPVLSSVTNDNLGIIIKWAKVTGAEKYRVFYKTVSSGWTKIADTTATSYTWTGAKSTTTYTFTVRCISSDGSAYTSGFDSAGITLANAATATNGVKSDNISENNYTTYHAQVVNSYITQNSDGTLSRVEYINGQVVIETYSADGSTLKSTKKIAAELGIFGGFYSGSSYNYLVFGQQNPSYSNSKEVLRVVKYTKSWSKVSSVPITGENTYIPFNAGSLRMTETGGKLYIHTSHTMYKSSDGLNHQANMTFVINESTMKVEQSNTQVSNTSTGYVSHSFNQFIQTDGKYVFRVDHGDYYPRAITLTRSDVSGKITSAKLINAIDLSKVTVYPHYNYTGASIGGFELSTSNCIIAGNAVDYTKSKANANGCRNIFVSVTDKNLKSNKVVWVTKYTDSQKITVYTPQLVKLGNDKFLLMWEECNKSANKIYTKAVTLDGNGKLTSDIVSTEMRLSDCQPIKCKDGFVRWYVTDNNAPTIYSINPNNLKQAANSGYAYSMPKLSSVENTATGIHITWEKVTGAAKYRVFYKTATDGWTKIADTSLLSYIWTGAKSGTKYTFTVRCITGDGMTYTSSYDSNGKSITFNSASKTSTIYKPSSGITVNLSNNTSTITCGVFYNPIAVAELK